jgi:hypothetical protein
MSTRTPIIKNNRLSNAVNVTMRDILLKDLLSETEKNIYFDDSSKLNQMNIFIDYMEYTRKVLFNFSINGEPAITRAEEFEMYLVSGNNNEMGNKPIKICGTIENENPDTLVSFLLPQDEDKISVSFSQHNDGGYSYSNYTIYCVLNDPDNTSPGGLDTRERLLLCKGKIYKTNLLYDLTEAKLDGQ